ncbi:MAG: tRNA (guanosine(46)-N7)-methyltransferase TrmB [Clostridia bacterium]|nr:tRNA (guanosine(46)-N7)-methyltransferase TrmB [Clostridia bacterium]
MRMRKKKWARPEIESSNFFINNPIENRGKWHDYFENTAPIHLELGCGKGNFISKLAHKNKGINYIAIDMIDDMLGYACRKVKEEYGDKTIENVAILAYDIERILDVFDENDTIDRIYINFCNPWPRPKHRKRRLTHTRQLEKYKVFLADDGEIHFKTDDDGLYKDTLEYLQESGFEIIENIEDLEKANDTENIVTEHEQMFMNDGIKIKKIIAKKK